MLVIRRQVCPESKRVLQWGFHRVCNGISLSSCRPFCQPFCPSFCQPFCRSFHQPFCRPFRPSSCRPVHQPFCRPFCQPFRRSFRRPFCRSLPEISKPVGHFVRIGCGWFCHFRGDRIWERLEWNPHLPRINTFLVLDRQGFAG